MTTLKTPKPESVSNTANDDSLIVFWYQPWLEASHSAFKLQHIWLETVNDALRHEIDFISTMTPIYSKLTNRLLGFEGLQTPTSMLACYLRISDDMTDATYDHMCKVSELGNDFRELIWSEL